MMKFNFDGASVFLSDSHLKKYENISHAGITGDCAIDCSKYSIFPGFVDVHVHFREPGFSYKETIASGSLAAAKSGYISVGEDSGLSVNALHGAPGVYSARYAGEHGNDKANNEKLLKELSDKSDRSAKFVCTIACIDKKGETRYFVGETEGIIIDTERGEGGFGYDPLFYYEPMEKTFSELTAEQKNAVSHRGKAIELFAEYLKTIKD